MPEKCRPVCCTDQRNTFKKRFSSISTFYFIRNLTNGVDDFDRIRRTQMSRVRYGEN